MPKKRLNDGRPKRGEFFYVDLHQFYRACAIDADAAAAYLIIVAGTGRQGKESTWSALAISERTNLTRPRAQKAIASLCARGLLIKTLFQDNQSRPRYEVVVPPPPEGEMAEIVQSVREGGLPTGETSAHVWTAFDHGYVEYERMPDRSWRFYVPDERPIAWLPNDFVNGVDAGPSPLEKLRLGRDSMTLKLLVDLYALHDLPELAGIDRRWLRRETERKLLDKARDHAVWRFSAGDLATDDGRVTDVHSRKDLWVRVQRLEDAGLLEWVYCLTESAENDSSVIMPVCLVYRDVVDRTATETEVGWYAVKFAEALEHKTSTSRMHERADLFPAEFVVPVTIHASEVQMVGIPRLRYRPKTGKTARWAGSWHARADEHIAEFKRLIQQRAPNLLCEQELA